MTRDPWTLAIWAGLAVVLLLWAGAAVIDLSNKVQL